MVYASLYQGIRTDGPLMAKLAQRQPETLLGFMDKVEEFINQEDTIRAIINSWQSQLLIPKVSEEKKKNPQVEHTNESKPRKQFKVYNFTPLNASIHEVLMEIKNDPEYVRPLRIQGNP
jgi:hypothetical protein